MIYLTGNFMVTQVSLPFLPTCSIIYFISRLLLRFIDLSSMHYYDTGHTNVKYNPRVSNIRPMGDCISFGPC